MVTYLKMLPPSKIYLKFRINAIYLKKIKSLLPLVRELRLQKHYLTMLPPG